MKAPSALSTRMLAAARRAAPLAIVVAAAVWSIAPWFRDLEAMGFQDWDVQAAFRYVSVMAVRDHHEWPWWNPWLCGGYPAWSFSEAATNLVSPWAPFYFLFSFPVAVRLEAAASLFVSVGAMYLLAGRYTRNATLRALVTALWALNGRWALQVSTGHMWHCAYAWSPLVIYFFDRAVEDRRLAWSVAGGAILALMVYVGGIYPVPHTALLLGLLALATAAIHRSIRPLGTAAIIYGVCGGLAAPKLMPILGQMSGVPRLIASKEKMRLGQALTMLTTHQQSYGDHPLLKIEVNWVWWEWGMYVGWLGVAVLVLGLVSPVLPKTWKRALPLQIAGLFAAVCAFGSFAKYAPWPLLHKLPVFASQHLPSRWLYPAAMFLVLAFAVAAGPWWERGTSRLRWLNAVGLALICAVAVDLTLVNRQATSAPFQLGVPEVRAPGYFQQRTTAGARYRKPMVTPLRLRQRFDWPSKLSYPAMLANTGVVKCYGVPLGPDRGAVGRENPTYRGEVYVLDGPGQARLTGWSPSSADIEVTGARPGDLVVYNMNWDRGWTVNGQPAAAWRGAVAARVETSDARLHLQFRPLRLSRGLGIFANTVLILIAWCLVARWRRGGLLRGRAHDRATSP